MKRQKVIIVMLAVATFLLSGIVTSEADECCCPTGIQGHEIVSSGFIQLYAPGEAVEFSVSCPEGKVVLGGGGGIGSGGFGLFRDRIVLNASFPPFEDTWTIFVTNTGDLPLFAEVRVYAICAEAADQQGRKDKCEDKDKREDKDKHSELRP